MKIKGMFVNILSLIQSSQLQVNQIAKLGHEMQMPWLEYMYIVHTSSPEKEWCWNI